MFKCKRIVTICLIACWPLGAFAATDDDYGRVAFEAAQCFVADGHGGACAIEPRPASCNGNLQQAWYARFNRQCVEAK
jgi:hypothetical protein